MDTNKTNRDKEIASIWVEYKFVYQILGGLLLVGCGIVIGAGIFSEPDSRDSYLINLYTSVLSIVITVFVLDLLNKRRDEKQALLREKQDLIRDIRSSSNEVAKHAIFRLRNDYFLDRNVLVESFLFEANLAHADLSSLNLSYSFMYSANLEGANLLGCQLEHCNLRRSNLKKAKLTSTRMSNAQLSDSNLEYADLRAATLKNVDLMSTNLAHALLAESNLKGAILKGANLIGATVTINSFDETTVLPDGNLWNNKVDLSKYGAIIVESTLSYSGDVFADFRETLSEPPVH